jgi:hypothetical protein
MRNEPEPPEAGTEGPSAVTCNPHLVDEDGAVTLCISEDDPQADVTSAATTSVVNAANERDGPLRPGVATVVPMARDFTVAVKGFHT